MKNDRMARHATARERSRGVHGLVKIRFVGDEGDVETLWAYPLGADRYRLENIPLHCGVAYGDVVEALVHRIGDIPEVTRVVAVSGSITISLLLNPPLDHSAESRAVLQKLSDLGCGYEVATQSCVLIDVPLDVDVERVREFLESTGQRWGEYGTGRVDSIPDDEDEEDDL